MTSQVGKVIFCVSHYQIHLIHDVRWAVVSEVHYSFLVTLGQNDFLLAGERLNRWKNVRTTSRERANSPTKELATLTALSLAG